jgi:hypothetical protein
MFEQDFPDVLQNERAMRLAQGIFQQISVENEDKPFQERVPEMELHRAAITQAAQRLGIRKNVPGPAPSPGQRARFAGAPPSSTGPGQGGVSRPLTSAEKKIAIGWAEKGTPPTEAYSNWAKFMGPDYFSGGG